MAGAVVTPATAGCSPPRSSRATSVRVGRRLRGSGSRARRQSRRGLLLAFPAIVLLPLGLRGSGEASNARSAWSWRVSSVSSPEHGDVEHLGGVELGASTRPGLAARRGAGGDRIRSLNRPTRAWLPSLLLANGVSRPRVLSDLFPARRRPRPAAASFPERLPVVWAWRHVERWRAAADRHARGGRCVCSSRPRQRSLLPPVLQLAGPALVMWICDRTAEDARRSGREGTRTGERVRTSRSPPPPVMNSSSAPPRALGDAALDGRHDLAQSRAAPAAEGLGKVRVVAADVGRAELPSLFGAMRDGPYHDADDDRVDDAVPPSRIAARSGGWNLGEGQEQEGDQRAGIVCGSALRGQQLAHWSGFGEAHVSAARSPDPLALPGSGTAPGAGDPLVARSSRFR